MRHSRAVYEFKDSPKEERVSHNSHLTAAFETTMMVASAVDAAECDGNVSHPDLDIESIVGLITSLVSEQIPDASASLTSIIRDNIELALKEGSRSRRVGTLESIRNLEISIPEPLNALSPEDIDAIRQVGKEHDWDSRGSDMRNPLRWVLDLYGPWIPGLMTCHIKQADLKLYFAFMRYVGRNGLPIGIDIPTQTENEARRKARSALGFASGVEGLAARHAGLPPKRTINHIFGVE